MYRIVILPDARKDILKASQRYEDRSENAGLKFKMKAIEYIDTLQSDFVKHGQVFKGLSRVFMKGFPYQIFLEKMKALKLLLFTLPYIISKAAQY